MKFDIVIIGAGPSGLCFAQALAESGLRIAIIERQPESALAAPAFDGREIALTQRSAQILQALGIWQRIPADAISALQDAQVLNGPSLYALRIHNRHQSTHKRNTTQQKQSLGYLLANHEIRKAAYDAVKASPAITLLTETQFKDIRTQQNGAYITLNNGEEIETQLVVAADSRFSETRRAMGISASMHDFGKTMMVCVMEHTVPHHHTAWEWFDYGQTLALLPMNGMRSSVVITLPANEIQSLMTMSEEDFNQAMQTRFQHRLGTMHLTSTRHAYPLVTAYANRMVAQRFALIGDAAVGMHPVTAHGFNFGLSGADLLATQIIEAQKRGTDIAANSLLAHYQSQHRRNTKPLFLATHAIAKLYSDDSKPAHLLRTISLRVGNRITPFKRAVAHMLTQTN